MTVEHTPTAEPTSNVSATEQNTPAVVAEVDNNCNAPCWKGITPGITTSTEAFEALGNIGAIRDEISGDLWLSLDGTSPQFGGYAWQYRGSSGIMKLSDGIVEWISISDRVCLLDLIELYGEPSHVVAARDLYSNSLQVELVWLPIGLSGHPVLNVEHPEIDKNLCLNQFVYAVPTLKPEDRNPSLPGVAVPWHGYDSTENYLPDE